MDKGTANGIKKPGGTKSRRKTNRKKTWEKQRDIEQKEGSHGEKEQRDIKQKDSGQKEEKPEGT